jgi:hypothetical protein
MRVLLDTNILIHREAATVIRQDIGTLFFWLDKLGHEKVIHPASAAEIAKHGDPKVRAAFAAKLQSYHELKTIAPTAPAVLALAARDTSENDRNDTLLISEVYADRVDLLITEDRGIHTKATTLGIADRVFTIDAYLEKVIAENPSLVNYKVLSVRKQHFGNTNINDEFFNSFRDDYGGNAFNKWFNKKSDEPAYVCLEHDQIAAFLYLKLEPSDECYADITPPLPPKRRLKIGSFKVNLNGFKLGERFLKIIFDNAIKQRVDELYVTIFPRTLEQQRLIRLLEDHGFANHGTKTSAYGEELVYTRDMTPRYDAAKPKRTFPYVSKSARTFLVPIYPAYHTSLLPDSILRTESPKDFVEHEPHRNAISKVYVSRSYFRALEPGDLLVFYRTRDKGSAYYESVVTTIGIVEEVHRDIKDEEQFIRLCRKRSVFDDKELREHWNYNRSNRPFITGFLYAYSFPKRPNLKALIDHKVIKDIESAPRGFERINPEQFSTILQLANADPRVIVD